VRSRVVTQDTARDRRELPKAAENISQSFQHDYSEINALQGAVHGALNFATSKKLECGEQHSLSQLAMKKLLLPRTLTTPPQSPNNSRVACMEMIL